MQTMPDGALRFVDAIECLLDALENNQAVAWQWLSEQDEIRRVMVPRFPYRLIYEVIGESQRMVLAIAHLAREPGYWRERRT